MPSVDFEQIRSAVESGDYEISVHAFERMRRRGISVNELEEVILHGEIIERDRDARPFPKCIFWGFTMLKGESIHVVCSITPQSRIVTVYYPDEDKGLPKINVDNFEPIYTSNNPKNSLGYFWADPKWARDRIRRR